MVKGVSVLDKEGDKGVDISVAAMLAKLQGYKGKQREEQ